MSASLLLSTKKSSAYVFLTRVSTTRRSPTSPCAPRRTVVTSTTNDLNTSATPSSKASFPTSSSLTSLTAVKAFSLRPEAKSFDAARSTPPRYASASTDCSLSRTLFATTAKTSTATPSNLSSEPSTLIKATKPPAHSSTPTSLTPLTSSVSPTPPSTSRANSSSGANRATSPSTTFARNAYGQPTNDKPSTAPSSSTDTT